MSTETVSGFNSVTVLERTKMNSDYKILWHSDCFLIPGTQRLLRDERPASQVYS